MMGDTSAERRTSKAGLRKGTYSCWACKRRKEKCSLGSDTAPGVVCMACQRRGTRCIGQDQPEELTGASSTSDDRLARIEGMIERLLQRQGHSEITSPASTSLSDVSRSYDENAAVSTTYHDDYHLQAGRIAAQLRHAHLDATSRAALLSGQDLIKLCQTITHSAYVFNEFLTMSYATMDALGLKPISALLQPLAAEIHPILIARRLIQQANALQQLPPGFVGLSSTPRTLMTRLMDAATAVMGQLQHVESIESLECMMLETVFLANCGHLRLGWRANRRAMSMAQAMGLHSRRSSSSLRRLFVETASCADPYVMWSRIIYFDRQLSLMLGLPHGWSDVHLVGDSLSFPRSPMEQLERSHSIIAAQIQERNKFDLRIQDFTVTEAIDRSLQDAARALPSQWWMVPDLASHRTADNMGLLWDLRRLGHQMFHYNLLNQLHVPYMVLTPEAQHHQSHNSRIACVSASREILSRFVVWRSFDAMPFSCRFADFLALMAAITLLIAHLDRHRHPSSAHSWLAHQYLSDRAIVGHVQRSMEHVSRLSGADPLSGQSAHLLRQMLEIEAEAAEGNLTRSSNVVVQGNEVDDDDNDDESTIRVRVPYFGLIKIARSTNTSSAYEDVHPLAATSNESSRAAGYETLPDVNFSDWMENMEDDAFQGVDAAFFESLTSISGEAWESDLASSSI